MRKALISYLIEELKPIRITTTYKHWKNLNYNNHLFSIKSNTKRYDWIKNKHLDITFNYNSNFDYSPNKFLYETSIVKLSELIDIDIIGKREIEIYEPNPYGSEYKKIKDLPMINDNHEISLDSLGRIPSRWLKMIHDFSGLSFKIDNNSSLKMDQFELNIEDKINRIKDDTLIKNFIKYAFNRRLYMIFIDEKSKWRTYAIQDGNDDYLIPDIVKKVYENAKNCYSLYPDLIKEKKDRYLPIDSFEGGIKMEYFEELAQYKLFQSMLSSEFHNIFGYLEGCNHYASGFNIPLEDVVIFGELLKKNGVIFRDSYIKTHKY